MVQERKAKPAAKKVAAKKAPAKKVAAKKTVSRRSSVTEFEDLDLADIGGDEVDDEVDAAAEESDDHLNDYSVVITGGNVRPGDGKRMTPGDRIAAELAAAMKARQSGLPVFPHPEELPDEHKPFWTELVNSKPHDYFTFGDIPLLKLYCRAAADIERLDRQISQEGEVIRNARGNPVVNPRVVVRSIAETRLMALATKLRAQPSARMDSINDKKQQEKKNNAEKTARTIDEDGDDLLAGNSGILQ